MISEGFKLSSEDWLIREKGYNRNKQGVYESLFTLGNGYLGVRGSLEENPIGSYRGTYIAGIFDRSESLVDELVKTPCWVDFSVWVGGRKFGFEKNEVVSHERILDMNKGILHRVTRFKDRKGRILKIETKRIVFAHDVHSSVMDVCVTAENFSEEIRVISGLNGDVTNKGWYPNEKIKHLNLVSMERPVEKGRINPIYLEMETRQSKIRIALASSTILDNPPANTVWVNRIYGEKLSEEIIFNAQKGKSYHFTKWVCVYSSREGYDKQLHYTTIDCLNHLIHEGLDHHLQKHLEIKQKQWEIADVRIHGDELAQKSIRFNIYHMIIAKPHHDPQVSIGARFLTGEGYKGHCFWDTEIFLLPFYIHNFPEDARHLLMYRYYTLDEAINNAKSLGYKGAKIAWESADTGVEETPSYVYREDGTLNKIFTAEEELHIVSDVVYGIFNYYSMSGDVDFLYNYGAEIIFQTARFWLSRVEWRRERYEIRKVIGPDELHEHVDNNAFTNYLVSWHLRKAVELYREMAKDATDALNRLKQKIKLSNSEIKEMKTVSEALFFPYKEETGLIEQFEGYFKLENCIVNKNKSNGLPKCPEDVDIRSIDRTQLIKQADVISLLYLFSDVFPLKTKKKNYQYYERRTMHESSLSLSIHAIMGSEVGKDKKAFEYFKKNSCIDLDNTFKNTDDGVHAAAAGGVWMSLFHGFGGVRIEKGILSLNPRLPTKWEALEFSFIIRGNILEVKINHEEISINLIGKEMNINIKGNKVKIKPDTINSIKI